MRRPKKGELDDDMVAQLNFGQGSAQPEEKKKSRKEIYEEIIAKNKLYRMQRFEIKEQS
jgi:hypothetical protein